MKRDLRFEVVYKHPIEKVWRALTDSKAIAQWLMENDFEPRLGHKFMFHSKPQPGWDGKSYCEVTELDPPRRLVVQGPYRFVRNPMYLGAGTALAGAALFFQSLPLVGFTALFLLSTHLFVRWYEEPTLRRTFGEVYQAYCRKVARWRPRLSPYHEERP